MSTVRVLGRRERNKAEKLRRIAESAARLFAAQGYARTTTQQVALAADVAEGTVFRYAATKPELLLMVLNEQLLPLVASGRASASAASSVGEAVLDLMEPLIDLAEQQPDNAAPFLREVLFGDDGPHRRESLALVDDVVASIADVLAPHLDADAAGLGVDEAARFVFSALVNEVMRGAVGRAPADSRGVLRARVGVLLRGLGVTDAAPRPVVVPAS
ncbi:TetR/AcrR family transcriptional regulator [Propioniciclava coleopterorum]|uniref:TetR/AcrR family transcriptional regulator n=1 Tax=Propioniciclava coleopterorum TaxID=2714937 RepID=A0A6G7Y419_9ACTN|nr:TetR/AcrR family transcriptional regulator [Propioniciclava coleopterorum]QIK71562.1 TetR/AcrR family transcriptional regulator [Propioniciclava coleopterorum]